MKGRVCLVLYVYVFPYKNWSCREGHFRVTNSIITASVLRLDVHPLTINTAD